MQQIDVYCGLLLKLENCGTMCPKRLELEAVFS
jgi:hypothetical protein